MKTFAGSAIVPVTVAVTGFVALCSLLLFQVFRQDLVRTIVAQERGVADTVVRSTRYAMLRSDREAIANIVDNIGRQKGVEHVRIFDPSGVILFSSRRGEIGGPVNRGTEGCATCHSAASPPVAASMADPRRYRNARREPVLAVTAPIYNDVECLAAPCHFHSADAKLLGMLDLGVSAAPLESALRGLMFKMAAVTVMVLIVTMAGVAAMLRRRILLPVQSLVALAHALHKGEEPEPLPPFGNELDLVARMLLQHGRKEATAGSAGAAGKP